MITTLFRVTALLALLVTPGLVYAQGMSGAGVGKQDERPVVQRCEMEYRNLRGSIAQLVADVNRVLNCNDNGQLYNPDTGGCTDLPLGPEHRWVNTTQLQFKNDDGTWGNPVELKGPPGNAGADITCAPAPVGGSSGGGSSTSSSTSSSSSSSGACDPWTTGDWGPCNGGTQTRSVNCPSGNCCGAAPTNSQTCNSSSSSSGGGTWQESRSACTANPSWNTGNWGNCSATCGGGTQTRSVNCQNNSGTLVVSYTCSTSSGCTDTRPPNRVENCTVNCNVNTRPADSQSCNTQACSSSSGGPGDCECVSQGPVRCSTLFGRRPMENNACDMSAGPNSNDYYIPCGGQCIRCTQSPYMICH